MHGKGFVLLILTYRAFSHDSTGRRPYVSLRRKGVGEEEGKRRGGSLRLPRLYFARAPPAIHLLKTWVLKVSTKVVCDH